MGACVTGGYVRRHFNQGRSFLEECREECSMVGVDDDLKIWKFQIARMSHLFLIKILSSLIWEKNNF